MRGEQFAHPVKQRSPGRQMWILIKCVDQVDQFDTCPLVHLELMNYR